MADAKRRNLPWLRVKGTKVINEQGDEVNLRGYCVGGWLNMENFIDGYPGQESWFRDDIAKVLGPGKGKFFFERLLDNFLNEDDIVHMASLGATVLRVPMNYRHFEGDMKPFEYKNEGFKRVDWVVDACRRRGIYVIFDLHAAPGWQNPDWHSDNPANVAHLWTQKVFQDRTVGLWEEFARRYRREPAVAGYNLLNEPVCPRGHGGLAALYKRLAKAIRKIDNRHILFLEGNWFSTDFSEVESSVDRNTVFSTHNYAAPAFATGKYPGRHSGGGWTPAGVMFNRDKLQKIFNDSTAWARKHRVPNWVGEFGAVYHGNENDGCRTQVIRDQVRMFNEEGNHWSIWTYKDIGVMGTAYVRTDSEWMKRTRKGRALKDAWGVDTWGQKKSVAMQAVTALIKEAGRTAKRAGLKPDLGLLDWQATRLIGGMGLSQVLSRPYAEQFRGMNEKAIARMMESFAWRNCAVRDDLADALAEGFAG